MWRTLFLNRRKFCYLVLVLSLCASARGQDACRDVLKQTQIDDTSLWSQKLAYLWSINTSEEFEDAKSMHGGLKTIIDVIPIEAEANYSAFIRWRKQFSEKLHWTMDTRSARHLVTSFLPPEAINAWLACTKLGSGGLTVFVTEIAESQVTFEIRWNNGPTPGYVARLSDPQVKGGTLIGTLKLPKEINSDYAVKPSYTRSERKNEPLVFRMEYGSSAFSFTLPQEPQVPQVTYSQKCKISLRGELAGADKTQDFVGVAGNYPPSLWFVSCSGFEPNIAVRAFVSIDFEISPGGNQVSVAPFFIANGSLIDPQGNVMSYSGPGPTGVLTSTVAGRSSSDGTATIGIYVGIPAMNKNAWTLSARSGSYIQITKP
jgi:hypothetical protein